MRIVAFLAAACIAVGVASAQTDTAAPSFHVDFVVQPTGQDYADNYPHAAAIRQMAGLVALCCGLKPDRHLDCRVAAEWPQGQGFAAATLVIASKFEVTQQNVDDFQATPGAFIQRTIAWTFVPTPPELAQVRERFAAATRHICEPAAESPVT